MKSQALKGMRDLLPAEQTLRDYIQGKILETYRASGFERISTPMLEDMENLDKSDGGDNLNLIFKVMKRGDKLTSALGSGDPKGEVELVPDAWTVFEQIAPIYMHGMIFGAMTESFCAEQSARMTAMDSATKSANDMIRDLQLEYNRTRQGSITQEITEIIGGAAAVQDRT